MERNASFGQNETCVCPGNPEAGVWGKGISYFINVILCFWSWAPGKIWVSAYTGIFFSLAALKKQNPTQTVWQHQRNSKRFVVKQLFNNMIFHMQAQVKFLTYWRNLHFWLQREQRSPRRVSCSTAQCIEDPPPPRRSSLPRHFSLHLWVQWYAGCDNSFKTPLTPYSESVHGQITARILLMGTF